MESTMKRVKRLIEAFGRNEADLPDFPRKISGIAVSRIIVGNSNGCSRCFPHGYETINSRLENVERSWKRQRKNQWTKVVCII
jgi:hypothetical protein